MKIPIMNIGAQYVELKKSMDKAMQEIAGASRFILGEETVAFESDICRYCGVKHAIGVASGTDALILALTSLRIARGDEVITSPYTFFATAEAVSRVGAVPVFADIDADTYDIDPGKIEAAITDRTRAIIPVHLYGNPCDMKRILDVAQKHNLAVVEDAAQAIGATFAGRKVGSFGHAGCFSFFPSKNLGAFGDGGMIVTNDAEIAQTLKLLRVHGTTSKYCHAIIGYNSRLDNIQAAILSIKLKKLDGWNNGRRLIAEQYDAALGDIVTVPRVQNNGTHVYHLYVVRVEQSRRDGLVKFLNDRGIESRVYYPVPLHLQQCYRGLGYKQGDFPEAERVSREAFALPMFPELKEDMVQYVVKAVRTYLER